MPRPVCGNCQRRMVGNRVGVAVGFFALATGTDKPHEVYMADEYKCHQCGQVVVCNYGNGPVWMHFHDPKKMPDLNYEVPEQ